MPDRQTVVSLNPLNPATGDVPVPEDPRELQAALRAGVISYRIFPYIEWRFGERGRKFTRSDSAWLAWLVRLPQDRINEQVQWLRSVLSNRGLPGWILEIHLDCLAKTLSRAVPERYADYDKLRVVSRMLAGQRRGVMSDETWQQIAYDFAANVTGNNDAFVSGIGRLLVAAVIDQQLGIKNAHRSLNDWLVNVDQWCNRGSLRRGLSVKQNRLLDDSRFKQRWLRSLQSTLQRTHESLGK